MPGRSEGFCEGVVFPLDPPDEAKEPFRDEEEDSISSLEESSLHCEVLPELEEANCCPYNAEKGDIRYCHPILTSSRLWFWILRACLGSYFTYQYRLLTMRGAIVMNSWRTSQVLEMPSC